MSISIRSYKDGIELNDLYEGVRCVAERSAPISLKESHGFFVITTKAGDYLIDPITGEIYPANEWQHAYEINEASCTYLSKLFGGNKIIASPVLEPTSENPSGSYWQVVTPTGVMTAVAGDRIVRCGIYGLEITVVPKGEPLPFK
jgi:hypothetical protein